MLKHVCFIVGVLAVIVALTARPVNAADDIESKAQACAACHGENGVPTNAVTPIIWGQQSYYLYKDLHDYHSGALDNPDRLCRRSPRALPSPSCARWRTTLPPRPGRPRRPSDDARVSDRLFAGTLTDLRHNP